MSPSLQVTWKTSHAERRPGAKAVLLVFLNATEKPDIATPVQTKAKASGAQDHRRRPRRPPFLRVESEGVGVTSSIRPIFMPERARARSADWAPGPGVLVPLPGEDDMSVLI